MNETRFIEDLQVSIDWQEMKQDIRQLLHSFKHEMYITERLSTKFSKIYQTSKTTTY